MVVRFTETQTSKTIPGIRIGHASDFQGLTGCTVILCEGGAVCGVDVRGSAAGTRDLAPCHPGHVVERVHAVFLSGGSAFGLDAAAGVMRYLESRGIGFPAGRVRVPIVPGAVIFDLHLGSSKARPSPEMALRACRQASREVAEGSVGAGTGATVGKLYGIGQATKGGLGFRSRGLPGGVRVQALAVVNAFGDVVDPRAGSVIAGARLSPRSPEFAVTAQRMMEEGADKGFGAAHTTLVVIMTNAELDKVQATKIAQMGQDGLARAIQPVHTQWDGDLVFALSLGKRRAELNSLGTAAAEVTAEAIVRAVEAARGLGGVPSCRELRGWGLGTGGWGTGG
jgi:L-aminopeptidase/D-esterase-like protein